MDTMKMKNKTFAVLAALVLILTVHVSASPAQAQSVAATRNYPSAEGYDVTITPPSRPGSAFDTEAANDEIASLSAERAMNPADNMVARHQVEVGDNTEGLDAINPAAEAVDDPSADEPNQAVGPQARHSIEGGWSSGPDPWKTPAVVTPSPSQPSPSSSSSSVSSSRQSVGPLSKAQAKTAGPTTLVLQVGAYRRQRSAEDLKDKLLKTYDTVYVNSIVSAGEPLYRVRIGLGAGFSSVGDLKKELIANGYPCFAVREPKS